MDSDRGTHVIAGCSDVTMAASDGHLIIEWRVERGVVHAVIATPQTLWESTMVDPFIPRITSVSVVLKPLPTCMLIAAGRGLGTRPEVVNTKKMLTA